ncbi:cytochrome C [Campylobacter pinnipediorum subsp. caledonicus]|uniref:cytochrome c3 family protein n=1 Tax=Campylobacter pinnipediorum TaxID=1965231 RepID=UPI000994DAEF|nr:NapC/NirT family cytochrome c [Campylobacter pinnipediorum]AQW85444.1 NapC/NirT cytochrome c family protein [Campylobacter pinnipediorum subsp. caledonicus]OPA72689.1 cytochrome C [Campylobacter pinnipediorum subsp. caledonicus]
MKKRVIFFILIIGGLLGLLSSLGVYYGLSATSDEKFCVVCHEMDPIVIAYSKDIHSGIGKTGVKAKCVDCHLPHDNIINYIYAKARNGVVEGAIHFFGDAENINWHENRKHRKNFVFDDGCLNCHTNIYDNKLISAKAHEMHDHYKSLLNTDKKLGCASCHVEVGHTGLQNMLNYWNPQYEAYKEKALKKKEELRKEYFK